MKLARKKDDLLSFKVVGGPLQLEGLAAEFQAMKDVYGKEITEAQFRRVGLGGGTHLIKLTTPRTDLDQSILRIIQSGSNRSPALLPSVNAPDIPIAKIVYRPLPIEGHTAKSVVEHLLAPDEISVKVLSAFESIFGSDALEALREGLLTEAPITKLPPHGEFPIIFAPRPGGEDLQITPVAPAAAFMGMKRVKDLYFQKASPGGPRPPRGKWMRQAVSAKPQNISGAIGGPRVRFLASMPALLNQEDAELYRYINGGRFPRWREDGVAKWIQRYADSLDADAVYNNTATRNALNGMADNMIGNALKFIRDTVEEAKATARLHGLASEKIPSPPPPVTVLLRRKWGSQDERDRARRALTSPHFEHRLTKAPGIKEGEDG